MLFLFAIHTKPDKLAALKGVIMKSFIAYILVVFCSLFALSGCATSAYFYDKVAVEERPDEVNLYIDHLGDIYPTTGVPANTVPRKDDSVGVRSHIERNLCKQPKVKSDVARACEIKNDTGWKNFQTELWKRKANDIFNKANSGSEDRSIVVLIHGFRNLPEEAKVNYDLAQSVIKNPASPQTNPIFVNIYWDGFYAPNTRKGLASVPSAWLKAQASGPLVGFNLRQLFNEIDNLYETNNKPEPSIKVITHSSGAFVIGATIGDTSTALKIMWAEEPQGQYGVYKAHAKDTIGNYRVPDFKDFRIAMYAAATPSNTFSGKFCPKAKTLESCNTLEADLSKANLALPLGVLNPNIVLLIAYNPYDVGPTKNGIIPTKSSFGGAAGLGADNELICDLINTENIKVYPFDMIRGKDEPLETHNFDHYLLQKKSRPFLQALMNEGGLTESNYKDVLCRSEESPLGR